MCREPHTSHTELGWGSQERWSAQAQGSLLGANYDTSMAMGLAPRDTFLHRPKAMPHYRGRCPWIFLPRTHMEDSQCGC